MPEHQPSEQALEEAIDLTLQPWDADLLREGKDGIAPRSDAPQRVARALDARDRKMAEAYRCYCACKSVHVSNADEEAFAKAMEALSDD